MKTTFDLSIMDYHGHLVHYLPFVHVDIEKTNPPPPWIHILTTTYFFPPDFLTVRLVLGVLRACFHVLAFVVCNNRSNGN